MALNKADIKQVVKISDIFGVAPTVAPTNDHTDGTWLDTSIYVGEFMLQAGQPALTGDTSLENLYIRTNDAIRFIPLITNSGTTGQHLILNSGGTSTWTDGLTIANNGLTVLTGTTVQLGGALVKNTTIESAGYNLSVGSGHTISTGITNSMILGGSAITATTDSTVYTPNINIQDGKGISFGTGNTMTTKTIEIGDWDMTAASFKAVSHGLSSTEWKTIRRTDVIVRDDGDALRLPITAMLTVNDDNGGSIGNISSSDINVWRRTSGTFDNASFNTSTSFNRGWVTFDYTPD